MGNPSVTVPLLPSRAEEESGHSESPCLSISVGRWVLKILMWATFVAWSGTMFFFPTDFVQGWFAKILQASEGTVFEITGGVFLIFSVPVLLIASLAYAYVTVFSEGNRLKRTSKFPRFRLRTFPILVDGPFGVVSAAEFFGIIIFIAFVLWAMFIFTMQSENQISRLPLPSNEKSYMMLEESGLRLGLIGLFCTAFLFLPIARGSILLRLIDVPFEQATRYHVWLGHLTMMLFTLHGICYVISWSLQGHLLDELLEWKSIGVAKLPGVISLLAGLLMWVTSLGPVRKRCFELFFYTHQLYVVFIFFLAMHVGDFVFSIAAGGIFLYALDRFLRFCQSRTTVSLISAACLPCGTLELVISKPARLKYNALSFIFLQVRELSWLQWHPFSVSSSPLDGSDHVAVLIKVLGEWTGRLRDIITRVPEQSEKALSFQANSLTASIEGPYGHEVAYHLVYENLILVAGGIGISPFLAILRDILHMIEGKKPCLPKNILVIWAVKKSKELSLLSVINSHNICSTFSDKLNLSIQAYVTQESEASLEEGGICNYMSQSSLAMSYGSKMSSLVGTGNNLWSATYFFVTTLGFIISFGFLELFYLKPLGVSSWWYRGLLFIICMVSSVIIFGGLVVFFWHYSERENSRNKECKSENASDIFKYSKPAAQYDLVAPNLTSYMAIQYGKRPDFQDIFNTFAQAVGHVDVGVLVCGPPGLQTSVAKECRRQSIRGRRNQPIFHFNSHSFDL